MGRARHVIWPNKKPLYFSYSYTVILTSILAAELYCYTDFHTGCWHSAEYVCWRSWSSAGGEVETTGGYFYQPGRKFFPFRSN